MKILYVVPNINNEGGVARVLAIKTNYLIEKWDYQIDILTQNKGNFPLFYEYNKKISLYDIPLNGNPFQFLKAYRKSISEHLNSTKPDVIVVCDNGFKAFLIPFIIKTKIPIVLEIHSSLTIEEQENNSSSFSRIAANLITYFKKFSAKKFDKFIVETNESIREWDIQTGIVIPNPLWFSSDKVSDLKSKKVIAVGRHVYEKGFDRLLKIWQKVVLNHPDWHLDIYGKSDEKLELQKLATSLNINNNVTFFDPVKAINLKYQEASIYLLTSRFEGFGMVLIEAMESGLPCIAYDCPCGPRAIITNNDDGFLIENGNEIDFVSAVETLINNDKKRIEMGKKAIFSSSKYNIDEIMPLWDTLFKNIKTKSNSWF
jgi:glycosyltransferase involved in cell wall biosynthesis